MIKRVLLISALLLTACASTQPTSNRLPASVGGDVGDRGNSNTTRLCGIDVPNEVIFVADESAQAYGVGAGIAAANLDSDRWSVTHCKISDQFYVVVQVPKPGTKDLKMSASIFRK
jgi:hypothetical protein